MKYLVVGAHNNEDVKWTDQFKKDWVVVIDVDYRPMARDVHTHLKWIIAHYEEDFERCVLCQGNPFDHCPNFIEATKDPDRTYFGWTEVCDKTGMPRCDFTPLHSWADVLGLELLKKNSYRFVCGTQYQIKPQHIRRHPIELWQALFSLGQLDDNHTAWVLERLYPDLFGIALP